MLRSPPPASTDCTRTPDLPWATGPPLPCPGTLWVGDVGAHPPPIAQVETGSVCPSAMVAPLVAIPRYGKAAGTYRQALPSRDPGTARVVAVSDNVGEAPNCRPSRSPRCSRRDCGCDASYFRAIPFSIERRVATIVSTPFITSREAARVDPPGSSRSHRCRAQASTHRHALWTWCRTVYSPGTRPVAAATRLLTLGHQE